MMYELVIIDDEPKAIELLLSYVERIASLSCIATFRNPIEAISFIRNHRVDCVLVDINMPQLSGIEVAKILPPSCRCIFVTAYSKYAAQSYDLGATDYLLKPISFERFSKAIQKLQLEKPSNFILVKSGYDQFKIKIEEIFYLKKEGNYMAYHTKNKKILSRQNVAEALAALPIDFIQIHKSYIVKSSNITRISSNKVFLEDEELPLGSTFRAGLIKRFEHKKRYPNR